MIARGVSFCLVIPRHHSPVSVEVMTTSPAANKIDPTDPVNAQILEEWKQRQKEVEEREKKEEHDLETQPPLPGSEKPLYSFTNADHPVKEHHEDSENW